jgi:uncharacterized MAPEG superfamily protein
LIAAVCLGAITELDSVFMAKITTLYLVCRVAFLAFYTFGAFTVISICRSTAWLAGQYCCMLVIAMAATKSGEKSLF